MTYDPWGQLHAEDFEQRQSAVMDLSEQVFGDGQNARIVLVELRDGQQHETEFAMNAKLYRSPSGRQATVEPMPRFTVDRYVREAVAVNVYTRGGLVMSVPFASPMAAMHPGNTLTMSRMTIDLSGAAI